MLRKKRKLMNIKSKKTPNTVKRFQNNTEISNLPKKKYRRFKIRENTYENTLANISIVKLSEEQVKVLKLGSKFCPTPLSYNTERLSADVHEGCRRVRLK